LTRENSSWDKVPRLKERAFEDDFVKPDDPSFKPGIDCSFVNVEENDS
jgi:hypothetical protein